MPLSKPKEVNGARYFIDERNQVCADCALRLFSEEPETISTLLPVWTGNCTECLAFAAGYHPALTKLSGPTYVGIEAKLAELHAVAAQDLDYPAGILDGACSALGWVLGKTKEIEWEGR